jgi:hypothetical protein
MAAAQPARRRPVPRDPARRVQSFGEQAGQRATAVADEARRLEAHPDQAGPAVGCPYLTYVVVTLRSSCAVRGRRGSRTCGGASRRFAADGVDAATARELTTLTVAVIRGLPQDASATGDQQRVLAAFDRYASLLEPRL